MGTMRVTMGRTVEAACPHCGGLERRAFGETESLRGELASYALGWTSGHDDPVGYMTVGIGAGNPEGGSFHVEIRVVDGEWGMSLVDRPFESVPEGGPDLTREQALAHGDLEYVWWVADEVMEQDVRALWMLSWLEGTRAFVTPGVHDNHTSVLRVLRDEEGDWQLFDAGPLEGGPVVTHLHHLVDDDPSLMDALGLRPGEEVERAARGLPWSRVGS